MVIAKHILFKSGNRNRRLGEKTRIVKKEALTTRPCAPHPQWDNHLLRRQIDAGSAKVYCPENNALQAHRETA